MNPSYKPGDIFEFFDRHVLTIAYCIEAGSGKLKVLTIKNREIKLKPARILHATSGYPVLPFRIEAVLKLLHNLDKKRNELTRLIDIPGFWQILEAPGDVLSVRDCVDLLFNEPVTPDHEAAFIRAIMSDRIYFKLVDNRYVEIQTLSSIETEKKKIEKAQRIESESNALANWLQQKIQGIQPETKPSRLKEFIDGMIAFAAGQVNQTNAPWIKNIIKKVPHVSQDNLLEILIKIKLLSGDEDLDFIRYRIPVVFSKHALEEATQLISKTKIHISDSRRDLRSLFTFTIDSAETMDMDDAISFERQTNGSMDVYIHITDISFHVATGSFLDEEARERSQSLYFPEKTYHMFPVSLACGLFSLKPGQDRIVLTTYMHFDRRYRLTGYEIFPSVISVDNKYSYETVNEMIEHDIFADLFHLCIHLQDRRKENGAIVIPQAELDVRVSSSGTVEIKKRIRETPAQIIVSELMILTNYLAAEKARKAHIHFPFRTQAPPSESLPPPPTSYNPYIAYRYRRLMNRATCSLEPDIHFSLGLPCYTNITSPIRRYFDLIAQRQLKALLGLETPYDEEDISRLLMEFDMLATLTNQMAASRKRYWILKHLLSHTGKTLDAIVLDKFTKRYQIWLTEYLMDADLPTMFGVSLHPQDRIQVVIESVNPRKNKLKLRLIE